MKRIISGTLITLSALVLFTGCARTAMPNNIGGKYFMAGDDNCRKYRMLSDTRIMCLNADGQEMGYRDQMTDQELQMYMHNQNIQQQQSAQTNYMLQQNLNRMNYNTQQMMNRNNTYKFQYVNPYGY